jgi:hypothetical protein
MNEQLPAIRRVVTGDDVKGRSRIAGIARQDQ